MNMTLVSFYADLGKDKFYTEKATKLRARCQRLGIPFRIEQRADRGEWLQNTLIKASFIREMVQEIGCVLWLDVDSWLKGDVLAPAIKALEGCDVAIVPHGNKPWPHEPRPLVDESRLLHTPLRIFDHLHAWSPTRQTMALLDRWVELCERATKNPKQNVFSDHRFLQRTIDEALIAGQVRLGYLPGMGKNDLVAWKGARVHGRKAALNRVTKLTEAAKTKL